MPGMDLEAAGGLDREKMGLPETSPEHRMPIKEEREQIEKRLLQERARAIEAIAGLDQTLSQSLLDRVGELSVYRLHPADLGTESMETETQMLLASQEGERLYRIDAALRRLYDDPEGFGRCSRCGAEIARERLEVVPESELCADCQRAAEA
jgi:DnaK suppressor protein